MRHLGSHVDVEGPRRQVVEVLAECLPAPRDALVQRGAGNVLDAFHQLDDPIVVVAPAGREPDAAIAHHHRRDAVPRRRHQPVVPSDLAVVVGMDVHEAGRDQGAVGIDDAPRRTVHVSDRDDDFLVHGDVRSARRPTGAVDHSAATDEQVVVRHGGEVYGCTSVGR